MLLGRWPLFFLLRKFIFFNIEPDEVARTYNAFSVRARKASFADFSSEASSKNVEFPRKINPNSPLSPSERHSTILRGRSRDVDKNKQTSPQRCTVCSKFPCVIKNPVNQSFISRDPVREFQWKLPTVISAGLYCCRCTSLSFVFEQCTYVASRQQRAIVIKRRRLVKPP